MFGGPMFSGGMLGGGMMSGGMMGGFSANPQQSNSLPVSTGNSLTDQYGTGLKGYANWWNAVGKQQGIDREEKYAAENPTAGLSRMPHHNISLTANGLLDWDSTKPINALNVDMMKKFGIKGGDKIFDPSAYKSINAHQGAKTDGRLDAHYFAEGLAMPLRTDNNATSGMKRHEEQIRRNQIKENVSGTEFLSSQGLYQDRYAVGYHGKDDMGDNFVGSNHSESINQYINDYNAHRGTNDIRAGIDSYIRDGGYAGDALKILDGKHKANLTSSDDIKWYNSLVHEARSFDWEAENQSRAGDAGGYYDVRAGGLAAQYRPGGSGTSTGTTAARNGASQSRQSSQESMGLQSLQETADIGDTSNPAQELMYNQGYQRKYSLEAPEFLKQYTGKLLG